VEVSEVEQSDYFESRPPPVYESSESSENSENMGPSKNEIAYSTNLAIEAGSAAQATRAENYSVLGHMQGHIGVLTQRMGGWDEGAAVNEKGISYLEQRAGRIQDFLETLERRVGEWFS
jgi:hypothetical protein